MLFRAATFSISLALCACSIHPTPADVAIPTHEIVHQIRCETKKAIVDGVIIWLSQSRFNTPADARLLSRIKSNPEYYLAVLDPSEFGPDKQEIISKFKRTGIAYDFTLDMTEDNNVDPTLNVLGIFSHHGSTSLGLTGKFDRERENQRSFTITDDFTDLIKNGPICTGQARDKDFVYPITGRIGIDEMISEFVQMTLFNHLSAPKDKAGAVPGPATMADTLTFTTTLSLDATPQITLTPIGLGFHFKDFSLGLTAKRVDKHMVTIGLALPAENEEPNAKPSVATQTPVAPLIGRSLLARGIPGSGVESGLIVNAKAGSPPAELLAAQVAEQAFLKSVLLRSGTTIILP